MEDKNTIAQEELLQEQTEMYEAVAKDIQELVTAVSDLISKHPLLVDKNFSLYYQHGRLGYLDLDAFAKSIKLEEIVKKKENTEK